MPEEAPLCESVPCLNRATHRVGVHFKCTYEGVFLVGEYNLCRRCAESVQATERTTEEYTAEVFEFRQFGDE